MSSIHNKIISLFMCLAILLMGCNSYKDRPLVNDNIRLLSLKEQNFLNMDLVSYKKESSNEIMIYIVDTLKGADIASYSMKLHNALEIGSKKLRNGVLILFAKDDNKVRISVGYGLEGTLTNEVCKNIINKNIVPNFRKEKYFEGLKEATMQIRKYAKSDW